MTTTPTHLGCLVVIDAAGWLRCSSGCGTMISPRDYNVGDETGEECPARWRAMALDLSKELRTATELAHITPALKTRIEALGYVPGETPANPVAWLVAEVEESRLALAAEQGRQEGAPSSGWGYVAGYFERWEKGKAIVQNLGGEWKWRVGRRKFRPAPSARAAMQAADEASP